jgi:hypothetical protein
MAALSTTTAELAEEQFLEEWSTKLDDSQLAAAMQETQEVQFRSAMGMLDKLLTASSVYHERMSQINDSVIREQKPASFVGTLRHYQEEGFRWLVARFLFGEGAILVSTPFRACRPCML